MVLALIFALLCSISTLIGRSFGLGKHIWNLSENLLDLAKDIGPITKSLYGAYLAYSTSITFTKLSIIATYVRIFPNGPLRYSIFGIGVVVIMNWITSVFCIIFTCIPVEAAWDYTIKNARCIHIIDYFYTSAGVNIATDLLLCFLPLPTIWKLQMPKAQRVVVCIIFGMGTLYAHLCHFQLDLKLTSLSACAATVLRCSQLNHLDGIDVPCQPPHSQSSPPANQEYRSISRLPKLVRDRSRHRHSLRIHILPPAPRNPLPPQLLLTLHRPQRRPALSPLQQRLNYHQQSQQSRAAEQHTEEYDRKQYLRGEEFRRHGDGHVRRER